MAGRARRPVVTTANTDGYLRYGRCRIEDGKATVMLGGDDMTDCNTR